MDEVKNYEEEKKLLKQLFLIEQTKLIDKYLPRLHYSDVAEVMAGALNRHSAAEWLDYEAETKEDKMKLEDKLTKDLNRIYARIGYPLQ